MWVLSLVAVVVLVVGVVVIAGSSSGSDEQSLVGPEGTITVPASENPKTQDDLWDPNNVPDSAVAAVGGDPTSRSCNFYENSKGCSWGARTATGAEYSLFVWMSTSSFDEVRQRKDNVDQVMTTVGGKDAVRYHDRGRSYADDCYVTWGTSFGSTWIEVRAEDYGNVEESPDIPRLCAEWADQIHSVAPH
ncbi:DUF3558 family protein [Gordonia sp. CPCC 205515]|uniref:DUF3558 family protein n=1 Tax=Gordonia sp. CPCC 205515 TaxID=3140791 RepID=UPI003AF340DD